MKDRIINQDNIDIEFKQDYINIDKKVAISSEGIIFKEGDTVCHDGSEIEGETAIIHSFALDYESFDVIANTTRGSARISFLYHPEK